VPIAVKEKSPHAEPQRKEMNNDKVRMNELRALCALSGDKSLTSLCEPWRNLRALGGKRKIK
jgi:hypothetical protein